MFKTSHAPRNALTRSATTWNPNGWLRRKNGRVQYCPCAADLGRTSHSYLFIRNSPEAARGATNRQTAGNKAMSVVRIARYQVTSYTAVIWDHLGTGSSTALGQQPSSGKCAGSDWGSRNSITEARISWK